MVKISVIIPVYNVEKYLSQCLDSVINQTFKDIEIICVNDGSSDNSLEILKDYAQRDDRIIIKNFEENKGVSAARNWALNIAKGEYIYFIDSDDWIEKNYLEVMFKTIEQTGADIIMNRNMLSCQNGEIFPSVFQSGQNKIKDNTFIDIHKETHNISFGPCAKLHRTSLLKNNNITFPVGYVYEDMFFHLVTFAYSKKIYFFKGPEYYYRKTEGSITSKMKQDSDKIINILGFIYDYYKEHNLLGLGIKIYYTMPLFTIQNEKTYNAFKSYFLRAGDYILNSDIYNDMDKFLCKNILETKDYNDYISKFSANVAISYLRRKK